MGDAEAPEKKQFEFMYNVKGGQLILYDKRDLERDEDPQNLTVVPMRSDLEVSVRNAIDVMWNRTLSLPSPITYTAGDLNSDRVIEGTYRRPTRYFSTHHP